jgi:gag-polyprotein putative aspartyl protease
MSLVLFRAALLLGAVTIRGRGRLYARDGTAQAGSELRRYRNCGWGKLCLLLSLFCFLPSASLRAQDRSEPGAAETEIPFVLYLDHMIVVEGRIGPLTHLRFTLDTGATHSIVDRKIADALKLERRPGSVFNLDDFVAIEWADFPSIAVGPIEVKNGSLMVGDLVHVDALIGMDLLRLNKRLRIDYNSRQVVFTPVAPSEPQTLPTGDPACLTVDVPVQGKPLHLIVDTGIEGILLYRDRVFKRNPKLRLENETQQSRAGGHLLPGRATLRNIRLPNGEFSARVFLIAKAPENALPNIDGYLATTALQARELDFDFSGHKFSWK